MGPTFGEKLQRFMISTMVEIMPLFPLPSEWYRKVLVSDSEHRYASGGWDYQRDIVETHRYSIIHGWIDYYMPGDRKVLDVGCGEGILQKRMAYTKYVGVDMNAEAIRLAQSRENDNTKFVCCPAEQFEPKEKFDVIIFNESLYYMPQPLTIVEKYREFLSTDGIMIICMFKTYLARKIWEKMEKSTMVELYSAKITNQVGFASVAKLYSNSYLLDRTFNCEICLQPTYVRLAEHLMVPSDSRRMLNDFFAIWRCSKCDSLHALSKIPQDPASRGMPVSFLRRKLNRFNRIAFNGYYHWLQKQGIGPKSRVLFYGVNANLFKKFFREKNFENFDTFEEVMSEEQLSKPLSVTYDAVIILDYLERTEKPMFVFQFAARHLKPDGTLILHAPDADEIHLPKALSHVFQQPYRLHIASWTAMRDLAQISGFKLQSMERRSYQDTKIPFINSRTFEDLPFFLDGSQESAFDFTPSKIWKKWWRIPRFLYLGFLGGIFRDKSNVIAVFKNRPQRKATGNRIPSRSLFELN